MQSPTETLASAASPQLSVAPPPSSLPSGGDGEPRPEPSAAPEFEYDADTGVYHRHEASPSLRPVLMRRQTSNVVFLDSSFQPQQSQQSQQQAEPTALQKKQEIQAQRDHAAMIQNLQEEAARARREHLPFLDRLDDTRIRVFAELHRRCMPESIWVILTMLAAGMSVIAWVVDEVTERMAEFRNNIFKLPRHSLNAEEDEADWWGAFFQSQSDVASFFLIWSWMMFWGLMAVAICKVIAPQAAGSGIEQIRSIMTGYSIPGFLTIHTLTAKILALICVQASKLMIGKEGPFVHIACSYGNVLLDLPWFKEIKASRTLAKSVIGAACASGIASTFGSPVGGVLFAIEVTSNVYHTSDYWKAFYTAVVGNLIFRFLSYFGAGRSSQIALFPTTFPQQAYTLSEIPLFILLSVLAGFYGGYFVKVILGVRTWRLDTHARAAKYFEEYPHGRPIKAPPSSASQMQLALSLLDQYAHRAYMYASFYLLRTWAWSATVLTIHTLGAYTSEQFMKRSLYSAIGDFLVSGEMAQNDFLGMSADHRMHNTDWGNPGLVLNLVIYLVFGSILFALAMSLPVPSGTMIVMMSIGLSFGRLFGELCRVAFGMYDIVPGGYALVGASAYLAGTTGAISTAVVMFEITGQLSFMVPVLMAVIIARACGKVISPDIYEALQITRNLPNIPPLSRQSSYGIPARDLMSNSAHTPILPRYVPLIDLEHALHVQPCPRYGGQANEDDMFAIVTNKTDRHYMVAVSRAQLELALEAGKQAADCYAEGANLDLFSVLRDTHTQMTPACPHNTPCIDVLYMFELSLASTIFVTENARVIGWMELAAIKHRIEHTNL